MKTEAPPRFVKPGEDPKLDAIFAQVTPEEAEPKALGNDARAGDGRTSGSDGKGSAKRRRDRKAALVAVGCVAVVAAVFFWAGTRKRGGPEELGAGVGVSATASAAVAMRGGPVPASAAASATAASAASGASSGEPAPSIDASAAGSGSAAPSASTTSSAPSVKPAAAPGVTAAPSGNVPKREPKSAPAVVPRATPKATATPSATTRAPLDPGLNE